MKIEPFDWNVVVVGFWNPAILTPAGIAQRLFGLEPGTPIGVEVPLDGLAPFRVKHESITVTVGRGRLTVFADAPKYDLFERGMRIAAVAIKNLPETPISGAGFNLRFRIQNPPESLVKKLDVALDDSISDHDWKIASRSLRRALAYKEGVINFDLQDDNDEYIKVVFNFHLEVPNRESLHQWLCTPIQEVKEVVSTVFEKVLCLELGEVGK